MSDRSIINIEDDLLICECDQEKINALVDKITETTSEEDLKLVLIDKIERFDCYSNNQHLLVQPIRDPEEQKKFFSWLNDEIRARLNQIASEGLRNLEQHNQQYPEKKYPFIQVIIFEIEDMDLPNNLEMRRTMLTDDNAGVYFIAFSKATKADLDLGVDLNMFKVMDYEETIRIIAAGDSPEDTVISDYNNEDSDVKID